LFVDLIESGSSKRCHAASQVKDNVLPVDGDRERIPVGHVAADAADARFVQRFRR
jgi:hypothetical protein